MRAQVNEGKEGKGKGGKAQKGAERELPETPEDVIGALQTEKGSKGKGTRSCLFERWGRLGR